jgi:ATP-dependent helicase HrpB
VYVDPVRPRLPIDEVLPDVVAAVRTARAAVVVAPPGAGKTTRVPPALLDVVQGRIVVLEPRRVAARAAARRMAEEAGGRLGDLVGYRIRMDRVESRRTRVLVVTEGVLVRMLHDDPLAEGIGAVVVDEFHERSIHADLALAMTRHVRHEVRPDLALVVMSATMEPAPVAQYLGGAPVIDSAGRSFPVDVRYRRTADSGPVPDRVAAGVRRALDDGDGDVLAFLPGVGEIHRTASILATAARERDLAILPLYGDLPGDRQDAVLRPGPRRKVVLATNVAETSITIDGIAAVVDAGLARVPGHDPAVGMDRLELRRISAASADQRAGRAGRTGPGRCLRLWTMDEQAHLPVADTPDIARLDLAGPALTLLAWGEHPESFAWFEAPPGETLERAMRLLRTLGALDVDERLTELGRAMAGLPLHPRLARLVLQGVRSGAGEEACLLAALLAERPPVRRRAPEDEAPRTNSRSDVLDLLSAVEHVADAGVPTPYRDEEIVRGAARRILSTGRQLMRRAGIERRSASPPGEARDEALMRALLTAYPDRLARRRGPGSDRARMVGGRGVRLAPSSGVLEDELLVCVEMAAGRRGARSESFVRLASAVELGWLPGYLMCRGTTLSFDETAGKVVARERVSVADLVLVERPVAAPDADAVARVLAAAAATDLERALSLDEPRRAALLARWRFLRRTRPELALPDPGRALCDDLLPLLCAGRSSLAELRAVPLTESLLGLLSPPQRRALDTEAPERIVVPGGRAVPLQYSDDGPPVLAARIQELFGLADTPRVAGGRVPVMVHLLAPSGRPQQITADLRSFWDTTYAEVRKELRARYPKHAWPEDPWTATASSRLGRRRR